MSLIAFVMKRFPSFSFLSFLASNPRSFSCFSRLLFIDSFMAAFFSREALGCLPSHYALFSGDLVITLFFLKGSASLLALSGRRMKALDIASADRSLFAYCRLQFPLQKHFGICRQFFIHIDRDTRVDNAGEEKWIFFFEKVVAGRHV